MIIPELLCTHTHTQSTIHNNHNLHFQIIYNVTGRYETGIVLVVGEEFPIHFRIWSLLS